MRLSIARSAKVQQAGQLRRANPRRQEAGRQGRPTSVAFPSSATTQARRPGSWPPRGGVLAFQAAGFAFLTLG